jgi:hypothetical protein
VEKAQGRAMMTAKQCRARAVKARKKAGGISDPALKAEFLDHGRLWIVLAERADTQDALQLRLARN